MWLSCFICGSGKWSGYDITAFNWKLCCNSVQREGTNSVTCHKYHEVYVIY